MPGTATRNVSSRDACSCQFIKPNPFTAYRDPCTGQWCIIQPVVNGVRIFSRSHTTRSLPSDQWPISSKN